MKLAIFDFDGTLFPLETIPFLIKQYRKQGYGTIKVIKLYIEIIPLVIHYKLTRDIDKEEFRKSAVYLFLKLFSKMTKNEVNGFFEKNIDIIYKCLTKEIIDEVKMSKVDGYETVLLSGCFEGLLVPLGKRLNFDHIIGTKLQYTLKDGKDIYDDEQVVDIIAGSRKAEIMKSYENDYDLKASKAYADSYYDKEILELTGDKYCVNPDHKLYEIAKLNNWHIINTN